MSPNFTGTWTFNAERSRLQIPAPRSVVVRIDHQPPWFRLARTYTTDAGSDEFAIGLPIDGDEISVEHRGRSIRCRCRADGDSMHFDSVIDGATNTVRYRLAEGGNVLIAEERFRSAELDYDNTWVLDRG